MYVVVVFCNTTNLGGCRGPRLDKIWLRIDSRARMGKMAGKEIARKILLDGKLSCTVL